MDRGTLYLIHETLEKCPNPYTRHVQKFSLYARLQRMTLPHSSIPTWDLHPGYANCVTISEFKFLSVERDLPFTRITEVENSTSSDVSQEELEALRMEANTWGLLQAVMP